MEHDLKRFTEAHERSYRQALSEMKCGKKTGHWMWYIFPQLRGLGKSRMSYFYGIADINEAREFLNDPYLGGNLREISEVLLQLPDNDIGAIMGFPDNIKLKSSMTLFHMASPGEPWHIRYLGIEKATSVYESSLCLEEYLGITSVYSQN